MGKWKAPPRAGGKCSADKPIREFVVYQRAHRLHSRLLVEHEYAYENLDLRAVGTQLLEGWISA